MALRHLLRLPLAKLVSRISGVWAVLPRLRKRPSEVPVDREEGRKQHVFLKRLHFLIPSHVADSVTILGT